MGNYSAPIEKLVTRLNFHTGTGQILDGWKFEAVPVQATDGLKDLPGIRLYIPTASEAERGAFVIPSLTVNILLSTKRTTTPNALTEHLKALEKLLDAIDTDENGKVDAGLGGSLRSRLTARTGAQYMLDVSVNTELTLNLEPRAAARGSRRS